MPPPITRLEDLPNIGRAIAADLRAIGIVNAQQLASHDALAVYLALAQQMAHRHDPCVLYALQAAKHFMQSGEALPWWKFAEQGRQLLAATTDHGN